MMREDRDREAFAQLVRALDPWLGQLVFVGGWAHRLYRLHPLAQTVPYPPLMTRDADVVVPEGTPSAAENIEERLLAAGFREEFFGESRPPVTHYQLGGEYGEFYAEFLTPLVGSTRKRRGTDETTRIAGVTAQRLRHVEVLMIEPWFVTLHEDSGFPLPSPAVVRIPNAASYLVQKLLIHAKRKPSEKRKDILYIHDTLEVFGRSLAEVKRCWIDAVQPALEAKPRRAVKQATDAMFGELTDVIRNAAASSGRALAPRTLREVCRLGLSAIFE